MRTPDGGNECGVSLNRSRALRLFDESLDELLEDGGGQALGWEIGSLSLAP
jgi:hypothetical protein